MEGRLCAATGWLGLSWCYRGRYQKGLALLHDALGVERYQLQSREGVAKWLHEIGVMYLYHTMHADDGTRAQTPCEDPDNATHAEESLFCLWMAKEIWEEIEHVQGTETDKVIAQARQLIGDTEYNRLKAEFIPSKSSFGEYTSSWVLGPFRRHGENPILRAQGNGWESRAAFNPGALIENDRVYLFYRAEGTLGRGYKKAVSSIGLAVSHDGINFLRDPQPIIFPEKDYEQLGGCENPRVVKINEQYYMTYTAYDGRVARICLAVSDNLREWQRHGPIFTDDQWRRHISDVTFQGNLALVPWSKSGAMLAHKVNGVYWMYFGDREIWLAHSEDLSHWEIVNEPVLIPRESCFDSQRVEPGPPPMITDEGIWLGYNAVDESGRYAFGQALFDRNDPARLLHRSNHVLLEPSHPDELSGRTDRVVYGQGLVQFQGRWLLYYGMSDEHVGVASAPILPGHESALNR